MRKVVGSRCTKESLGTKLDVTVKLNFLKILSQEVRARPCDPCKSKNRPLSDLRQKVGLVEAGSTDHATGQRDSVGAGGRGSRSFSSASADPDRPGQKSAD